MAVKLHRCSGQWIKIKAHPCWRVEKALIDQGIEYEPVPGPLARSKRDTIDRLSGQRLYPVIEFEDGSVYREQSKQMEETIRAGKLRERQSSPAEPGYTVPDPGL
jgi:hypothetical protein